MSDPRRPKEIARWYGSGARRTPITEQQRREMGAAAWSVASRLMAGILLYTGIGWLVSLWVGHTAVCLSVGMIVGLGLSMYLVIAGMAHETRQGKQ